MSDTALNRRQIRILMVLADDRSCHGYAIGKRIEADTDGRMVLRPGSLYRALHQLLERGLIRERAEDDDDPRRRSYELSPAGERALGEELEALGDLVEQGRALGIAGSR